MPASERLVAHALSVDWDGLPEMARQAAREFLFDTIAVGCAGRNAPDADAVASAVAGWVGPGGSCPVLGRPDLKLPAPYAAYLNAFQIHAQEFDCVHEQAVAHPLATVASVLLAEATRSGSYSGTEFLAALVAGVDVVATLGIAAVGPLTFFRPATAGIFGSVCALARLRRLQPSVARDAMGYALAFASGTMQAHIEGKPTLAIQVAAAARSAMEAVDLAVAGLPGAVGSIDGPFGYFSLFEDSVDLAPALAMLGKVQHVAGLSWKPFPTGRAAHGAIVALQQLKEQGLDAATLAHFVYRAPPLIKRLVGRRPKPAMDVAYARLCFAWLGAVVLTRGTVGLDDFTRERLDDPLLLALAERIFVEADETADPAAFVPAVATATIPGDGTRHVFVTRQFGSPAWPLDRAQQIAKARACLVFGGLPPVEAELALLLDTFDALPDAAGAVFGVLESK
jgi:2-methylcitrate dehydratase PrpD